MTFENLLAEFYRRNVKLVIVGNTLRARAPSGTLTPGLRQFIVEHKDVLIGALGEGEFPDETLPREIIIPVSLPNTVDAIRACIDEQRLRSVA